jgi:hypothetical protein
MVPFRGDNTKVRKGKRKEGKRYQMTKGRTAEMYGKGIRKERGMRIKNEKYKERGDKLRQD